MARVLAKENLKFLKLVLKPPIEFHLDNNPGNAANFSQNYKLYGSLQTWDLAWDKLNNLPENKNVFHELILKNAKVKPYLDVEWYASEYPELDPDVVLTELKNIIVSVFKKEWGYDLDEKNIFVGVCHRMQVKGYKYSYRIIVSTSSPKLIFENTNRACFFATKVRDKCKDKLNKNIIDMSVYKKTQNIRLIGHSKDAEFVPMRKLRYTDDEKEFIITNIGHDTTIVEVPEIKDTMYKDIKNTGDIDDKAINFILEKVKAVHPSVTLDTKMDANNFLQLNYTDRREVCFSDGITKHDKIGFFCFIQDNVINIGCHSGQCVDVENKKIIKTLGSLGSLEEKKDNDSVSENNSFNLDPDFIEDCINKKSKGISNMIVKMYGNPKRIKTTNDGKLQTYIWNGELWEEDKKEFMVSLLPSVCGKVIKDFVKVYGGEEPDLTYKKVDEKTIKGCMSIISQLNEGSNINSILRFLKTPFYDKNFSSIKDICPYKIACKNGLVDLKDGKIREYQPDDNITKTLSTNYNPDADYSDFDNFVRQITSSVSGPDIGLYNYLRWGIGYAIQGKPLQKKFFILYGEKGNNGKSLFMNIIKDVFNIYSTSMDQSVMVKGPAKTSGSHSSELCQLEYTRLGILTETEEGASINGAQVKALTGGTDTISTRQIYGEQKEFVPAFVPFVSSNHRLQINLKDRAMYDRLILIPFRLTFTQKPNPEKSYEKQGDELLPEKLHANKEGIVKWVVECSLFYANNPHLELPETIIKAKEEYKAEMDHYSNFIDKAFEKTDMESDILTLSDVIREYRAMFPHTKIDNLKLGKEINEQLVDYNIGRDKYFGYKLIEE